MRCGGNWRRDHGDSYSGTQGETPDTAKELPTGCRASSRPYHETTYQELGSDHFEQRDKAQITRRLIRRLEELGLSVEIKPAA